MLDTTTTTPGGRLVFHVFATLAEFIRELIVEGTHEGLDAARARGTPLGRPPAMTAEQIRHARDLLTRPDNTLSSIARLLSISRATIYKYAPEVTTWRAAAALPPGQEQSASTFMFSRVNSAAVAPGDQSPGATTIPLSMDSQLPACSHARWSLRRRHDGPGSGDRARTGGDTRVGVSGHVLDVLDGTSASRAPVMNATRSMCGLTCSTA